MMANDLFLAPGAPFFALSIAGVMLAALGLLRLEAARIALAGMRTLPGFGGMAGRLLIGQIAALALVTPVLLATAAGGMRGEDWYLPLALVLALYLGVGVVLPRRPLVQAQQERRLLLRLTPGFVSYVRVALAGYDSPLNLLERYAAQPRPQIRVLQAVVIEALQLTRERRLRPFEALLAVARGRDCRELTDVVQALALAEAEGADVQAVLAAHETTLEIVLRDEFQRMLKRRTLYLLGLTAVSLVVGTLLNLLFVMTGGGSLLMNIAG
jgi:hypothetical protein